MNFRTYTCRNNYNAFSRNQSWGVAFQTPNEYSSIVFGTTINKTSRSLGCAWHPVFGSCESTLWQDFIFNTIPVVEGWSR